MNSPIQVVDFAKLLSCGRLASRSHHRRLPLALQWDLTNPKEDQKAKFKWVITSAMELGGDQDLKPSQKVQK